MTRFIAPIGILTLLALIAAFADGTDKIGTDLLREIRLDDVAWYRTLLIEENGIGLMIGALIVSVAYSGRFNQLVRHDDIPEGFPIFAAWNFTTRLNYWMGMVMYTGTGLAILALCFYLPQVMVETVCAVDAAMPGTDWCAQTADGASFLTGLQNAHLAQARSPSALALGIFLPILLLHAPMIEPRFRAVMHSVALIPDRAQELYRFLKSDLNRFGLDAETRDEFLEDHAEARGGSKAPDRPHLHAGDFVHGIRDEGYLEIYPRIEFYLWRIETMSEPERRSFGARRLDGDLDTLRAEVAAIREDILAVAETIDRNFCANFPEEIDRLHSDRGLARDSESPLPSVTVLDNIVAWAAADKTGLVDVAQRDLADAHLVTLKNLGLRCKAVHKALVRMIVLMALYRTSSPRKRLREFGLQGTVDRMEVEIVPILILVLMGVAIGVTYVMPILRPALLDNQYSILAHSSVMPASALAGAYLIAAMRGPKGSKRNPRGDGGRRGAKSKRAASDAEVALTILGGLLASFAAVNFLPQSISGGGVGTVAPASYYTPVVALYGGYVAYAFFRQQEGLPVYKKSDLWRFPAVVGAVGFLCAAISLAIPREGGIAALDLQRALNSERVIWPLTIAAVSAGIALVFCLFMAHIRARQIRAEAEVADENNHRGGGGGGGELGAQPV